MINHAQTVRAATDTDRLFLNAAVTAWATPPFPDRERTSIRFQDNGLGPVLGTAWRTGAGGDNVWTHGLLRVWPPELFGELPRGVGFRVALWRATRTWGDVDVPLEDLGVQADQLHLLSEGGITGHNDDLPAAAALPA
ncbi:hypothetical protein [Streptomyces sp. NPDC000405]|uniref:hypothetical protein n=1 Tax=Streptomyces sp. NPDC000405 TaxID=3161033 RepID=UPI00398CE5D1